MWNKKKWVCDCVLIFVRVNTVDIQMNLYMYVCMYLYTLFMKYVKCSSFPVLPLQQYKQQQQLNGH